MMMSAKTSKLKVCVTVHCNQLHARLVFFVTTSLYKSSSSIIITFFSSIQGNQSRRERWRGHWSCQQQRRNLHCPAYSRRSLPRIEPLQLTCIVINFHQHQKDWNRQSHCEEPFDHHYQPIIQKILSQDHGRLVFAVIGKLEQQKLPHHDWHHQKGEEHAREMPRHPIVRHSGPLDKVGKKGAR